ncbi:MAG: tetratricopeptide repeat protein [Acidobacteria bacterium]|nr:tetratricopeptide repeat protein [Acidobacteriota bacterium]
MRTRNHAPMFAALLALVVVGGGCDLIKAKAAFKDGNKLYQEENYRDAIKDYERAVELKPDFAEAHVYLASAHQSLYRPGRENDAENRMHLDKAIEHYEKSLEVNTRDTPSLEAVRVTALGALTGIYSDPPVEDFEKALSYAQELVKDNPDDTKNMYAMANLYEKFNDVDDAEATYLRVVRDNPDDAKACGALSAFYNKPLWDRDGNVWTEESEGPRAARFEDAIQTMEHCATLDPNDPSGYYKVATFHWDKAYRDHSLNDKEKNEYADLGIEAVDKALEIQPDYWEAIITKGLLFRVKAQVAPTRSDRKTYLEQATILQKQALELRKEQQAAADAAAADVPPEAMAE